MICFLYIKWVSLAHCIRDPLSSTVQLTQTLHTLSLIWFPFIPGSGGLPIWELDSTAGNVFPYYIYSPLFFPLSFLGGQAVPPMSSLTLTHSNWPALIDAQNVIRGHALVVCHAYAICWPTNPLIETPVISGENGIWQKKIFSLSPTRRVTNSPPNQTQTQPNPTPHLDLRPSMMNTQCVDRNSSFTYKGIPG